jgi:endonuclease/exonuclease/phosphatase family metal-dependent hydrolase
MSAPRARPLVIALVVVVALAGVYALWARGTFDAPVRVGTYNIRRFGVEPTDVDRLAGVVIETRAAVLGLQEIQSEDALTHLEARIAALGGARYRHALATCGGSRAMFVGFLYDPARVELAATEELPELDPDGQGRCVEGDRAGLVGSFKYRGGAFRALVVHLAAGPEPERVERRRAQWTRALTIARRLRERGARRVVVLGDFNSTGWGDNRLGERDFITSSVRSAGLALPSESLTCSEFWHGPSGWLEPSLLDHLVTTPGMADGAPRVHGYCEALRCARHREPTAEYAVVSDHCPVTFDLARGAD